jgi:DNA-binding transcriptional ArsR family regulator
MHADEQGSDAAPPGARRPATDAEARALASSLRLRILRMTLDEPLTNQQIAERLGRHPASVLHHVRTLLDTGFLAPEGERRGARGAREIPYRATRKSWRTEVPREGHDAMVQAFLEESRAAGTERTQIARLGLRLTGPEFEDFSERLNGLLAEYAARPPSPGGEPWSVFLAVHPDPGRD